MDRRRFLKAAAGWSAALALPSSALARDPIGSRQAFLDALKEKPWLIGYLGTEEPELRSEMRIVSGKVPTDLQGRFYRNGAAYHSIGADRFMHWFDAPGMVQKFQFSGDRISHHGRIIETARNKAETEAGAIEYLGFGTYGSRLTSGGSPDAINTGNISLIKHADELLALWEGGSPYIIDEDTLDTKGAKAWSNETKGLPFGAHPRVDKDGSIWNVGYSIAPAMILLYHIDAGGSLKKMHGLPMKHTPMVHDFMITESKIVLVLPPFVASQPGNHSFVDHFEWQSASPVRVLVIDKSDLTQVIEIEMDPFWVFHFGNAFDMSSTHIAFDFCHHEGPDFMTKDAFAAIDGSWNGKASAASRYARAKLDLNKKTAHLEVMPEFGQTEFIQVGEREKLSTHRHSLMLSQPDGQNDFRFDRLLLLDHAKDTHSSYNLGATEILEEHLILPKPDDAEDFWIMGTSLDWKTRRTSLSIYEGQGLGDGPIMKAEMDIALPLGLHGMFVAKS